MTTQKEIPAPVITPESKAALHAAAKARWAKLSSTPRVPSWHGEVAQTIRDNFSQITNALFDATRRGVWLGLLLNHIKARGKEDGSIPHGRFGHWINRNLPDISRASLAFYMTIGRNVMEKANLPFSKFQKLEFGHPGELPKEVEPLIAGKTQNQLFLEYKQAKIKDDCFVPGIGRRKGEGGASKLQREVSQQLAEKARLEAMEIRRAEVTEWLREVADDRHLGLLAPDPAFLQALEYAAGYLRRLTRKGPAAT